MVPSCSVHAVPRASAWAPRAPRRWPRRGAAWPPRTGEGRCRLSRPRRPRTPLLVLRQFLTRPSSYMQSRRGRPQAFLKVLAVATQLPEPIQFGKFPSPFERIGRGGMAEVKIRGRIQGPAGFLERVFVAKRILPAPLRRHVCSLGRWFVEEAKLSARPQPSQHRPPSSELGAVEAKDPMERGHDLSRRWRSEGAGPAASGVGLLHRRGSSRRFRANLADENGDTSCVSIG